MKLVWSAEARYELATIIDYIAERNPAAAVALLKTIEGCAEALPSHPYLYRRGRIIGTREAVVHPNYLVIYEVGVEAVEIRSVIHSRREYPPSQP
jgi:plasmid stabilization system protein ParE